MKKFLSMALAVVMAFNFTFLGSGNIVAAEGWADYYDETWQLEGYNDEYVVFRIPQQSFKNLINSGNYKLVKYDENDVIIEFHKEDVKEIIKEKPSKLWKAVKAALWAAYTGIIMYIGASVYYLLNENLVNPNSSDVTGKGTTINVTDVNNKSVTLDVTKLNLTDINIAAKNANNLINLTDVNNGPVAINATNLLKLININGTAPDNSTNTKGTNNNNYLSDLVIRNNEFLNNQVSPTLFGNTSILNNFKNFFKGKTNSSNTQQQTQKSVETSQPQASPSPSATPLPTQTPKSVETPQPKVKEELKENQPPQTSSSTVPLSKKELEELQEKIDFDRCYCLGDIYDDNGKCLQPGGALMDGEKPRNCTGYPGPVIIRPKGKLEGKFKICRHGYDLVNNECIKSVNDLNTDANQPKNDKSTTLNSEVVATEINGSAPIVPEQQGNKDEKTGECIISDQKDDKENNGQQN